MSNKMLLALFVVGAVAVGTIAMRNKTNEVAPAETEQVATDVVETETDVVTSDTPVVAEEAAQEAPATDVVVEEVAADKNC